MLSISHVNNLIIYIFKKILSKFKLKKIISYTIILTNLLGYQWVEEDLLKFDKIENTNGSDITTIFHKKIVNRQLFRIQFLNLNDTNEEYLFRYNNSDWINVKSEFVSNIEIDYDLNRILFEIKNNNLMKNFNFLVQQGSQIIDEVIWVQGERENPGNAAFVHHGNQGLTYSTVFYGEDPQSNSGFDEILEVHQSTYVPGNFHLSGTLMSAAQWHQPEFNDWLATGVSQGWIGMLTSAFGQHIMPFVTDDMNNWSVSIENSMIEYLYGYTPRVAWVPERVWLSPGSYPDSGVIDWIGDNWTQHGVNAVILDGWPHCNNHSSTKIHWMNNSSGINLRIIPLNGEFVGNVHYNAGAAINQIQNTGQFDILVYGTDWEFPAEMNEYANTDLLDNYETIINWCSQNYPAVNIWKLDDAINNSDFNGQGIEITNGTYNSIGGLDGYGGNNNSWYSNWAGTGSLSDNHNPQWNYGTVWSDAYNNLMNQPNNELSQLGWYTMMVNLHETGWHDYMGGPISGWEHNYSSHIKNANVYAEASRWAAGYYSDIVNAFYNDIDHDGVDELILFNNKIYTVFESIGGKINWMFIKDEYGNSKSVIGSDMAYWSETTGDYNENSHNHFAGLSDVYPNNQNNLYSLEIIQNESSQSIIKLSYYGVEKYITLNHNEQYLNISYNFHGNEGYVKSGWSPDLLDLIWSGKSHLQRLYGENVSYVGQRNSISGATISILLGNGGSNHVGEFEGTLVKGDEIRGYHRFNIKLFAGFTEAPYDEYNNKIQQLDYLSSLDMSTQPYVGWSPDFPTHGDIVRIEYDSYTGVLNGINNPIHIHIGYNDWQNVIEPNPEMTYDSIEQIWFYEYLIPSNAYSLNFAFNNGDGYWDNNNGQDWFIIVQDSVNLAGDVNFDNILNVVDIVLIINHILENTLLESDAQLNADINSDQEINIVDIVQIVNLIL